MGKNILVIGGAGYVGSALVPKLLERGDRVTVYDTYWYGDVFNGMNNPLLEEVRGDIRDRRKLLETAVDMDAIVHLACISNDPSFDLSPELGKSINLDAFHNVLAAAHNNPKARFVYASSSSVYGVRPEDQVTELSTTEPLTDYSKFKLKCERILTEEGRDLEYTIVRPATVCGYSPRVRLDVVVNIFASHAIEKGKIRVDGGDQTRPNIAIRDMVRVYEALIDAPSGKIQGQVFNAGHENYSVGELARLVQKTIGNVDIEYAQVKDPRSYRINSDKIVAELGFAPQHTIESAVRTIKQAYLEGKIMNGLSDPIYHNIARMRELGIK